MEAVIFGAGVAGLMTAITLHKRGHQCRIYERQRRTHDAGMGFIVVPEGIRSLQALGVELNGRLGGAPLENYYWRDPEGKIWREQPMPEGARGIRRRDLVATLMSALPDAETVLVDGELGALKFDCSGSVVAACLADGQTVSAELYVGADGIHSRARRALFPKWPTPKAQVAEVVGLVQSAELIRWAGNNFNKFHALDGGRALGILPVDAEHLVWYLQFDNQRFSAPEEDGPAIQAFVQDLIGHWAQPIPQMIGQTDFSRVHLWRPVDTDLIPSFNRRNLALVGDAAHPLLPFTSQGVSSAVGDAVALATFVSAERSLNDALATYSIERHRECTPFIARGRQLMNGFLHPQGAESMVVPIA